MIDQDPFPEMQLSEVVTDAVLRDLERGIELLHYAGRIIRMGLRAKQPLEHFEKARILALDGLSMRLQAAKEELGLV